MERDSSISIRCLGVVLAIVLITTGLSEPAYCQRTGTTLMLQQTPAGGGTITPDAGIHHLDPLTDITLTAVPKPGYQFVYWLGDVSDPAAVRTTVYLDAPKIIIAVFERAEYEFPDEIERATGSYGGGGMFNHVTDYSRGGGGGGIRRGSFALPRYRPPQEPEPDEQMPDIPAPVEYPDSPAPGNNADFPAIPEPATVLLLGLGSLLTLTRRRKDKTT